MGEALTIGKRIAFYREVRRLNQAELARRAGISRRTLIMLENNEQPSPRLGTLRAIADVLGVHVKDLIPDRTPAVA